MADLDPIDRAYIEINGIQRLCESIDWDPDDKAEWVDAMTKNNEPLGVVSGNRHHEIKVTVAMLEGEEDDIDYLDLWESKTNVPVSIEFEGGRTASFAKGRMTKPTIKSKHGSATTWDLDLKCWQAVMS